MFKGIEGQPWWRSMKTDYHKFCRDEMTFSPAIKLAVKALQQGEAAGYSSACQNLPHWQKAIVSALNTTSGAVMVGW